jgi:hypothetical protein
MPEKLCMFGACPPKSRQWRKIFGVEEETGEWSQEERYILLGKTNDDYDIDLIIVVIFKVKTEE